MGQEKGLVNLNGDPMVSYVVNSMLDLVDEIVISVAKGRAGLYDEYSEIGFEIVEDREPGIGPLEGLVCALRMARGEYVLVGPCDTPFLKTGVCKLVLSKANGKDAAVPVVKGMFEPLHGAYRRLPALKAFEAEFAKGSKRRLIDAYDGLDIARVDESEMRAIDPSLESFWNLNSPQDLAEAEKRLGELPRD
jgi:molybdopterin-guanine dinucleotide biosynthesis protein A